MIELEEAMNGLDHDEFGLTEGDEILKLDLISAMLGLIYTNQAAIIQFIYACQQEGQNKIEALEVARKISSDASTAYDRSVSHSIQQYKERKGVN